MSVIIGLKNQKEPEFRGRSHWMYDEEAFKEFHEKHKADQEYRDFINFFKYGKNMIVDADGVENDD